MQTINNKDINNEVLKHNEFYIDTINNIFFSPDFFITNSYISAIMKNMEEKLISEDLSMEESIYCKFILGLCLYKLHDYFSAIKLFEDLINNNELNIRNTYISDYLYTILSISYLKIKNIDKHIIYYNLSDNFLQKNDLKELLLYLYLNTSITKLELFNADEVIYSNINKSFKILTEYEGTFSSQALMLIGYIYRKYFNLSHISMDLFNKISSISKSNNEPYIDILVKYHKGCTYLIMGKIHKGIATLKGILKIHNNILPSIFKLKIYYKILICLYKIPNISDDIKYFLSLYKEELYNIDSYYMDLYLARYYLLSVQYKIVENNSSHTKASLNDLFYHLDNANYLYKSNFSKFTFTNFEYWLEVSYGNLYFSLSNFEKALFHHKKALIFFEKSHTESNIDLYKLISMDYEKLSNYEEALKYYKLSVDSIDDCNKDLYIKLFKEFNNKIVINTINDNFFSNLSHELKTPVNIIYSSVQLMGALKDKDSNSLKEYFNKYEKSVKQNCLRMIRLINNLMDITKIDSGGAKLDLSLVDIVPFIEDLTLSIIPYTKYKNLNITFDTNIEKLYLKIDTYAFERIILNLLSNAIKFNNVDGNIWVSISYFENNVGISIKDTGIGIPDELRELIFNRFYKIDTSFSRNTEGSGIGLTITKHLIELHGGTIQVNPEYKDGSEFIITLPTIPQDDIHVDNNFKYFVDDEKILSELSDIYELF